MPSGFIREDEQGQYIYILDDKGQKNAVYVNRLAEEDNSTLIAAKSGELPLNGVIYNK